jgi:DNA modification methylase
LIETKSIYNESTLDTLARMEDKSIDIIFVDPPYALGSEVIIREDGKPDYKKAVDFMDKWNQPDGYFWEQWFKEAFRVLKYGGRIIMFGMDRQLMCNKYYACLATLIEQQNLYWYFIQNFPKASDLSKNIDKHFDAEREVVGKILTHDIRNNALMESVDNKIRKETQSIEHNITKASTDLAKKYDGYKYSVAPLKQTCETIMIFQKPYKTGSCLHDTLAWEAGDKECLCGALNIDGGRCAVVNEKNPSGSAKLWLKSNEFTQDKKYGNDTDTSPLGRYPAQTFIDSEIANRLDEQSGIGTSCKSKIEHNVYGKDCKFGGGISSPDNQYSDSGGCSKILHKCDYDQIDFDLFIYCPKVSSSERNNGCGNLESTTDFITSGKGSGNAIRKCPAHNKPIPSGSNNYTCGCKIQYSGEGERHPNRNQHPTIKPIFLLVKILQLFRTPNPQIVYDGFCGSGSIPIACDILGFDWIASEIDKEEGYIDIANARINYHRERKEYYKNNITSMTVYSEENKNDEAQLSLGLFDDILEKD